MKAREFISELKRMMDSKGRTDGICNGVGCSNCEFNEVHNRCVLLYWNAYESLYKTIEIVEEWSTKHPKKTNKNVFLKAFPDAKLYANGMPTACAYELGLVSDCNAQEDCVRCWNEEYRGVDVERLRSENND